MLVYDCLGANGFELCHPDNRDDWETAAAMVDGTPRATSWKPFGVHLVRIDEGKKLQAADAPWFGGHALVLRERAVDAMGPMLTDSGELLPLTSVEAKLWMYNPTLAIDALDEGASTILRFDDGRIMYVQRFAFRPDVVRDVPVFKVANLRRGQVFFGPEFVERWRGAGLSGLEFKEVWRSQNGGGHLASRK